MYKVKKCANCGALNLPDEVLCTACQRILPSQILHSDKPPALPKRSNINLEAPDPTHQRTVRPWPYGPASVDLPKQPWRVTVEDVDISFHNLMMLMVKLVLASIPAIVILFVIFSGLTAIIGASFFAGR